MKKLYLLLFTVLAFANAHSQCTVNVFASIDTIVCGRSVELSAFGQASIPVMSENFNTSSFGPGWSGTTQVMWNNPCGQGPDGTPHLWMGNSSPVPRVVTTASFNLSTCTGAGVNICFDFKMAKQTGGSAPCEGPDEPDEGIYVQYSIDNGTTWTNIHYFDPNGGDDPQFNNWNNWCFAVPAAALTSNARFRWFQDADSGADFDHWGLDNVSISCNDPSYSIVWQHDNYNAGAAGGIHPNKVAPHTTTTYNVVMSNGANSCTNAVTVVVLQPILQVNAGNDTAVCAGNCAQINATAKVIERPAGVRTYANNQPDTITFGTLGGFAEVAISVNTLNMATVLPNSILSVCIDNVKLTGVGSNLSNMTFTLICPGGASIPMVASGAMSGGGGLFGYNTVLNQTCFVPAGAALSSGSVPYTNSYTPSTPFNNLAGCVANGVWKLRVTSATINFNTKLIITGWRITFDDPELSYTGNYTWSPTTNMTGANTLTPTICPTGPATYTLTLTDTAGCATASDAINISTQTYGLGFTTVPPSCGQNNGSITVVPSPAGNYTYTWAGGATGATRSNLGAGSYAVTVTRTADNCQRDTVIQLNSSSNITANIIVNNQPTCAGNDGSVSLTLTGGTAPYSITIDTGGAPINITSPFAIPAPGQTLSNLAPMTVNVSITDAQGCLATATQTLTAATNCCTFSAVTATLVQPTCGQNNGSVTITGGNGSGTYTYAWSGGLGSANAINNVGAGSYTVTVTDGAATCSVDSTFTLNSNSTLSVSISNPVNPTCAGADGSVTVSLTGGTAPYAIVIDTGGTPISINAPVAIPPQTLSNLDAMTVDVQVTDGQGCIATATQTLTAPANCCTHTVSAAIVQPSCGAADGSITLTAANGSGNYTYTWAGGSGTGNTATNLSASNYAVTITDAGFANCAIDTSFTLSNPNAPVIDSVTTVNETCAFAGDGSATIYASGGTGALTYTWGTVPVQTTATATGLLAAAYGFTVTDATGCQAVGNATVVANLCCTLAASAAAVPPSCGQTTGSINVNIDTAGTTPYQYSIDGVTYGSTATFSNVTAGSYTIYVRDANNCADTVTITMPAGGANLQLSMGFQPTACAGANNGQASVTSLNGTTPFSYVWNTSATTDVITNLAPGQYDVTVTDNTGCTGSGSVLVTDAPALDINIGNDTLVCQAEPLVLNGPAGFASYAWSNGDVATGISPTVSGAYSLTVTDANGCTATDAVNVTVVPTAQLNLGDEKLVYEGDHVSLYGLVPNAGQNAVYNWSPNDLLSCGTCPNTVALAVDTLSYILNFTDENGCTASDTITLNVLPVVELFWPNAFSPNGDGNNEIYLPYGNNVKLINWKVFNRWGEKVFESTNFFQGWDGTYKGVLQNPQLFIYEAEVTMMNNTSKKFKGSFLLMR